MQYTNCNLCGADDTSLITIQDGYRMVRCVRCGLVYLNPRPEPEILTKMYNDYHQRDGRDGQTWAVLMEKNFRDTSALLGRAFPKKGKLLDVGCGYGHFVGMMQSLGWDVTGIEPSSRTVSHARHKGLHVIEATLDTAFFPKNSFDAVTAFYVLEHLFDPLLSLKKIFSVLKPGGMLILRVPHTTPIIAALDFFGIKNRLYDLPFHLYDFCPKTLKTLFEFAGFASVRIIPGSPTHPVKYSERIVSVAAGNVSRFLFSVSKGKILLPGVSKTVIASKPAFGTN
jgi:SAM-dependent methyltransferase